MISTGLVIWVLFAHYIADFVFQTRWMGDNKSEKWEAMLAHIAVYGSVLLWLVLPFATSVVAALAFVLANVMAHTLTDILSSHKTHDYVKHYAPIPWYKFWCVIGADQFAHQAILVLTLPILLGA